MFHVTGVTGSGFSCYRFFMLQVFQAAGVLGSRCFRQPVFQAAGVSGRGLGSDGLSSGCTVVFRAAEPMNDLRHEPEVNMSAQQNVKQGNLVKHLDKIQRCIHITNTSI